MKGSKILKEKKKFKTENLKIQTFKILFFKRSLGTQELLISDLKFNYDSLKKLHKILKLYFFYQLIVFSPQILKFHFQN